MKQDNNLVRSAADLERKYDFQSIGILKRNYETQSQNLTKVENELNSFVNAITKDLTNLQDQVDGNITTWFLNGIPSLENDPANKWKTEADKNNHLGDLYYDQSTGYAYRFSLADSIYSWVQLKDSDIAESLALANSAKDTADSKRRVFITQPTPPYDVGDLWIKDEELYRCQLSVAAGLFKDSDWIKAVKYTDDTVANRVGDNLKVLSGSVLEIKNSVDEHSVKITQTTELLNQESEKIGLLSQSVSEVQQTAKEYRIELNTTNKNVTELQDNLNTTNSNAEKAQKSAEQAQTTANEANTRSKENSNSITKLQETDVELKLGLDNIDARVQTTETITQGLKITDEAQGNELVLKDSAGMNVLDLRIDGNTKQDFREGINQLMSFEKDERSYFRDITDINSDTYFYKATPLEDNWIKFECDMTGFTESGAKYINTFINADKIPNLKPSTKYTIVCEFRNINITALSEGLFIGKTAAATDLIFDKSITYTSSDIETGLKKLLCTTYDELPNDHIALRNFVGLRAGDKFSFELRVSVLEGDWTNKDYTYESYGASPSPEFPSKIQNVKGITNLMPTNEFTLTKNNQRTIDLYFDEPLEPGDYTVLWKVKDMNGLSSQSISMGWAFHGDDASVGALPQLYNGISTTSYTRTITQPANRIYAYISNNAPETATITITDLAVIKDSKSNQSVPFGTWLPLKKTRKNLFVNSDNFEDVHKIGNIDTENTLDNSYSIMTGSAWQGPYLDLEALTKKHHLKVGDKVTYSIYFKTNFAPTKDMQFTFYRSTAQEGNLPLKRIEQALVVPGEWQRLSFTIELTDYSLTSSIARIEADYYDSNSGDYSFGNNHENKIWFAQPQFETGELTDYESYQSETINIDLNKENLFDTNILEFGGINASGYINNLLYRIHSALFNIEPNTTYTLNLIRALNYVGCRVGIHEYDRDQSHLSDSGWLQLTGDRGGKYTWTTSDESHYLLFTFSFSSTSKVVSTNTTEDTSDIDLENLKKNFKITLFKGSSVLPYYELSKINDTRDELEVVSGRLTKKIGEYIFTGDEPIDIVSSKYYTLAKNKIPDFELEYNSLDCICSHFIIKTNTTDNIGEFRIGSSNINFNFDDGVGGVDNFKQWLKEQYNKGTPVIVYYELETPEQIQLQPTDVELFEGYNRITLFSDLETEMYCRYVRQNDIQDVYQSKEGMNDYYNRVETDTRIQLSADSIKNSVEEVKTLIDENGQSIAEVKNQVEQTITSTNAQIEVINETLENGVTKLKNMLVTVDLDGMKVATDLSKVSTLISNNQFSIRTNSGDYLAFFGYDEAEKKSKAQMDNLLVTNYFTAGYHRIEKFTTDEGEKRTGHFYNG